MMKRDGQQLMNYHCKDHANYCEESLRKLEENRRETLWDLLIMAVVATSQHGKVGDGTLGTLSPRRRASFRYLPRYYLPLGATYDC